MMRLKGLLERMYATSLGENAVHGSDSDENAKIEAEFSLQLMEKGFNLGFYFSTISVIIARFPILLIYLFR